MNTYCMFKGKFCCAAPYYDSYGGNPHYIIKSTTDNSDKQFNTVLNSASILVSQDGSHDVLCYIDQHFSDPIINKLKTIDFGLHTSNMPTLDYWQDSSLLNIQRMRPIPYENKNSERFNINDTINQLLSIDTTKDFEMLSIGSNPNKRKFWKTIKDNIIVYSFGFMFPDTQYGLHETHMNQGNTKTSGHYQENGAFQDGGLIIQQDDSFTAIFIAFSTQYLPTDAAGNPTKDAKSLYDIIHGANIKH